MKKWGYILWFFGVLGLDLRAQDLSDAPRQRLGIYVGSGWSVNRLKAQRDNAGSISVSSTPTLQAGISWWVKPRETLSKRALLGVYLPRETFHFRPPLDTSLPFQSTFLKFTDQFVWSAFRNQSLWLVGGYSVMMEVARKSPDRSPALNLRDYDGGLVAGFVKQWSIGKRIIQPELTFHLGIINLIPKERTNDWEAAIDAYRRNSFNLMIHLY